MKGTAVTAVLGPSVWAAGLVLVAVYYALPLLFGVEDIFYTTDPAPFHHSPAALVFAAAGATVQAVGCHTQTCLQYVLGVFVLYTYLLAVLGAAGYRLSKAHWVTRRTKTAHD